MENNQIVQVGKTWQLSSQLIVALVRGEDEFATERSSRGVIKWIRKQRGNSTRLRLSREMTTRYKNFKRIPPGPWSLVRVDLSDARRRKLPREKAAFVSVRGTSKFLLRRMHVCRFMRVFLVLSRMERATKGTKEARRIAGVFPRLAARRLEGTSSLPY